MPKNFSIYKILLSLAAVLIAGFLIWQVTAKKPIAKTASFASQLENIARCLTEKNVTMYGADWCPHCQNEKKSFGEAFKFIKYVECPDNPQKCLDIDIKAYPTWIFPNGQRLVGEQGPEKLAQESGCELK